MFQIQGVDHVALTVRNVTRSVQWYQDVLGFVRKHQEVWGDCPAVMLAGDSGVALFPASGDVADPPDHDLTAIMRHLAFRVDRPNFLDAQKSLAARGINFTFEDHTVSQSIYFRDPDGYELELTTYELH